MGILRNIGMLVLVAIIAGGCSRPLVRDHAMTSKGKDTYTRIKRVAVFPFENYSEMKDSDKTIDSLLVTAVREEMVFDQVEDTRFVRDTMKKLKITGTDLLEKEVVKKLGDELNVQGILYGRILEMGKGKEKEAASRTTLDMGLLEPSTGTVLWIGNVSAYGGLTVGKIFGVTEGATDMEVTRDAVQRIARTMGSEVDAMRVLEKKGIVLDLKKEQDLEKAKVDKLKAESGTLQQKVDQANKEAKEIKDKATKDAQSIKSELELQKAAMEAEKAKAKQAQELAEKDKLKVEVERKKIDEDLKKIEAEKKKLAADKKAAEEAKKKAEEAGASSAPAPAPQSESEKPVEAPKASEPAKSTSAPAPTPSKTVEVPKASEPAKSEPAPAPASSKTVDVPKVSEPVKSAPAPTPSKTVEVPKASEPTTPVSTSTDGTKN